MRESNKQEQEDKNRRKIKVDKFSCGFAIFFILIVSFYITISVLMFTIWDDTTFGIIILLLGLIIFLPFALVFLKVAIIKKDSNNKYIDNKSFENQNSDESVVNDVISINDNTTVNYDTENK